MYSSTVLSTLLFYCSSVSAYTLTATYDSTNWYESFYWQDATDPTHGTVEYVSLADARSLGLTKIIGDKVYMGVDNTTVIPSTSSAGRKSNWITSVNTFTQGLLIGDFAHIPGSDCGSWPAFWSINNELGGEIDILESFSDNTQNYATLHTEPDQYCAFYPPADTQIGTPDSGFYDCTEPTPGCSVTGPIGSYGDPFNAAGGGVYALDWTSSYIRIYVFSRASIPTDITAGTPDPRNWGLPMANFESAYGDCDIESAFPEQTIYFDTTFCGSEAGTASGSWSDWTDCKTKTGTSTCEAYVRDNPEAFAESYWLVNSVKVYSI